MGCCISLSPHYYYQLCKLFRIFLYGICNTSTPNLKTIVGCMFAGKTWLLISIIKHFKNSKKLRCLMIRNSRDKAVDKHNKLFEKIYHEMVDSNKLLEVVTDGYDAIFIDEGQFFPDIVEFANEQLKLSKYVFVACISTDFNGNQFENIGELLAISDDICKCYSICAKCGAYASLTIRTKVECTKKIVVGGEDMYEPNCRPCFLIYHSKTK